MELSGSCILILLITTLHLHVEANNIRIGAFNVQVFGQTKAGKPEVMDTLAQIVQRYDIVLIQEIRDSKQTAIHNLLSLVNTKGPEHYDIIVSERLGRTSSKEQYAFLYRWKAGIEVVDTYQYPDPNDEFEREPFAVKFKCSHAKLEEFILAGIHVDPDTAVQEINSLATVFTAIQTHWNTENIAIMGDFNADCSYVGKAASKELVLRDDKYTWLIGDELDTTTKSTDCAYDRIILIGDDFVQNVVEGSAAVYRYDLAYKLTETETTLVSDHYPVEFEVESVSLTSGGRVVSLTSSATGVAAWWVTWITSILYSRDEL